MTEKESSYRQIFKSTSIFGGVQVFQILISIIRSKIVAVLLGTAGMGINGLLQSTLGFIGGLTNFGLGTSAVKNVAAANATGDKDRIAIVVGVLRRLVWITGLLGSILMLVLSKWLSRITFGNDDYTLAFIWISVTLLLNQISTGQGVVLRGTRQVKYLAQASLSGSILGLIISVPIYYLWGIDGIVPAIILTSVVSLLRTWYFSRKIKIQEAEITKGIVLREGKEMLIMGFMLSVSGLISLGTSYLIRIYISNSDGVDMVGLYTSGFAIINTYIGMIFTAMSTDYYPRLSEYAQDNLKTEELINQQGEIAVLIIAPILSVFIIFINFLVILLYSTKFVQAGSMIQWASLGIFFKAASWPVGFIMLAKGASKTFFWSELASNSYTLLINILGFRLLKLDGIGISFLISYFLVFIQVYLIARHKYNFSFRADFIRIFIIQFVLGALCFLIAKLVPQPWSFISGTVIIALSAYFSYKELDKRIGLGRIIKNLLHRK